ncbi:hypothetical protein [Deinococcus aerophilus]|uniref:Water stress and hypersensitive response domain-containing protein n=1 Tax=Deinococcus aerophilus TaxID=522488 RepID=A0ABQ2GQ86_9DEIO|nr:hypothetical protein [Deinococcus aerophilus]GGM05980.1 hypothetical protein GCM10010841_12890 [Deinococcus aerophilus]
MWLPVLALTACAPAVRPQPVQVWEGSARILLRTQDYRLTFTVDPVTHLLSGSLDNRSSGDRFEARGTLLPGPDGAELTAQLTAGDSPRLNASVLGFGVSGLSPKADALLGGRVTGDLFTGSLRVGGVRYPLNLKRVQ